MTERLFLATAVVLAHRPLALAQHPKGGGQDDHGSRQNDRDGRQNDYGGGRDKDDHGAGVNPCNNHLQTFALLFAEST